MQDSTDQGDTVEIHNAYIKITSALNVMGFYGGIQSFHFIIINNTEIPSV